MILGLRIEQGFRSMDHAKELVSGEEVVVLTNRNMIRGTFYRHQAIRFSDSLNAPTNRETPYLVLVDAKVRRIQTGRPVFNARFLMVAQSWIEVIVPATDIATNHILDRSSGNPQGKLVDAEQLLQEIASLMQPIE